MSAIDDFTSSVRIILISQLYSWKSLAIYRVQFIFQIFYSAIGPVVTYFFISVIYTVTKGLPGWSFYQLLFLSSLVGVVSPAVSYLATPAGILRSLRNGLLDTFLIRPYGAFTALMANYGDATGALNAIDSSILTIYAASHLPLALPNIAMFLIMTFVGIFLLATFSIMLVTFAYRIFRSGGSFQGILNTIFNYGQYPINIYGLTFTLVLMLIVPIGFATYVPAELIFGNISACAFAALFAVALGLIWVFYKVINLRLRGYTSAMG
jgi:ABC-2 type transport system permease protein